MTDEEPYYAEDEELSLLETLDHVLDRGLVVAGEVIISVANIDLIYLGLNLLVGSVETVEEVLGARAAKALPPPAGDRDARAAEAGEGPPETP